jgi:DNA-binding CsgD family transcriptional regulator
VAGEDRFIVLNALETLCDQGLLRTVEGPAGDRYAMLETVREFALARLNESGEAATVRDAHAAHFLALTEEADAALRGPDQLVWLRRLEADRPNLRSALDWLCARGEAELAWRLAGTLWLYWQLQGDFREARQWLQKALALPGAPRSAAWAKAQTVLGYLTYSLDDFALARTLLTEALAVWRQLGDRRGHPQCLGERAAGDLNEGDLERARQLSGEALTIYRALADDFGILYALHSLGVISLLAGDYARARVELEESIRTAVATGSPPTLGFRALGWLAVAEGDARRAAALWEERMTCARENGHQRAMATLLDDLGWLAARQQDWRWAAGCFAEELIIASTIGDEWDIARSLTGLATVSAEAGQPAAAACLFGAAEAAGGVANVLDDLFNPLRTPYECAVAASRQALGEVAYAAAWREGRYLPRQEAMTRALAVAEGLAAATVSGAPLALAGRAAERDPLSRREMEILRLLVRRLTDREIASTLFLSPRTVESHVARILDKLGVENRRAAVATAARLGLV